VAATPEEQVRQEVIGQLLAWGYPWHTLACEVGHPALRVLSHHEVGRADLLFNLRKGADGPLADAVIEVKAHTPRTTDEAQVRRYAQAFGARLYAVTDSRTWTVAQHTGDGWIPRPRFPAFAEWSARSNTSHQVVRSH